MVKLRNCYSGSPVNRLIGTNCPVSSLTVTGVGHGPFCRSRFLEAGGDRGGRRSRPIGYLQESRARETECSFLCCNRQQVQQKTRFLPLCRTSMFVSSWKPFVPQKISNLWQCLLNTETSVHCFLPTDSVVRANANVPFFGNVVSHRNCFTWHVLQIV